LRVEDPKFLRGQGCFVADISLPGELHCVLVRSPHAHARIRRIDKTAAAASAGVVAVFSGTDMAQDKVGPMAPLWAIATSDGKPMAEPPRWALPRDVVRHVGEAVAAIIAQTWAQAQDAADLLDVDYEPLPSVVDGRAAMEAGAPQLHETAPGNLCFRFARGDAAAVSKAFASTPHTVGLDLVNGRLIGAAIEPRAVLADGGAGKLTLYCSTQVPHHIRRNVAEQLGLPQTAIRLIAPDVGGGFGYKGKHYPEETIIAWAARRLRRPVKWVATRSECFLSDYQGRGHQTRAELAFDDDGHFLALRVDTVANIGAYVSTFGAGIPSAIYCALLAGVYRTPAITVQSTGVFTNTVPTDAYRGAGRPEACYVLERLADEAARELGIDRAEIRRRNLIPNEAMPYKTPIGPTYDCGDFPKVFAGLTDFAG
jgi:carbon-monoxide dehydrogenase large subunit